MLLAACASEPTQPASAENAETPKPQARACDEEPITGSHLRRCSDRGNVQVMSREDLQRMQTRGAPLPESSVQRR